MATLFYSFDSSNERDINQDRKSADDEMKAYQFLILPLFVLFLMKEAAFGSDEEPTFLSEPCYIDGNYVLLYKVINWWNDATPDEDKSICSSAIQCRSSKDVEINYDAVKKVVTITSQDSFADMLSVFRECENCKGPLCLKCVWLNDTVFENSMLTNAF